MSSRDDSLYLDAKLTEVLAVKFVDDRDNLSESQRSNARSMQIVAEEIAVMKIEGRQLGAREHWISRFSLDAVHSWAACPNTDPYADLLVADNSNGRKYRQKLPGVTSHDIYCRQELIREAFGHVKQRMLTALETKRERAR